MLQLKENFQKFNSATRFYEFRNSNHKWHQNCELYLSG